MGTQVANLQPHENLFGVQHVQWNTLRLMVVINTVK